MFNEVDVIKKIKKRRNYYIKVIVLTKSLFTFAFVIITIL